MTPTKKETTESSVKEQSYDDLEKEFMDSIDLDSVKKSLDAGIILPRLVPELDEVYHCRILSLPKFFESDYGKTMCFDINHKGLEMNLITPESFKFQLYVAMKRKGYVKADGKTPDFEKIKGKSMTFQKSIGSTKKFKDVPLYSVQIND